MRKYLLILLFLFNLQWSYGQNTGDPVVLGGVSIPLDFPRVNVTLNDNPEEGNILLSNINRNLSTYYAMILDNTGAPVWYQRYETERFDFKKQPNGWITMHVVVKGNRWNDHFIALDSTYTQVKRFDPPPGYYADAHELLLFDNGNYMMIGGRFERYDMSSKVPGGAYNATIRINDIIEMDADGNVVWTWNCMDHLDPSDALHMDLTQSSLDPFHLNSIQVDTDNNLLVSSRHLSQVFKINRSTGQIMWRLGGNKDSFSWVDNAERISYQHDMRVLPNGNYTLFDNRTTESGHRSRALELSLDISAKKVYTIWKYSHTYQIKSGGMGNVQRLPNGNTLINWGDEPYPVLTEVRPDGSRAFEMSFEDENDSYRVFRVPWNGKAKKPYLILEASPDRITLIFNKFGDGDVDYYNVYAGITPGPEEVIATSEQPFIHLSQELENDKHYYFRVTAVSSTGQESDFSNEEDVLVQIIPAGQNMVRNGDFANGTTYWSLQSTNGASASFSTTADTSLHIDIQDGTDTDWNVMLYQPNIQLLTGRRYLLEFDAWADRPRALDCRVRQVQSPYTNYSKMGMVWLASQKKHFSHEFIMEESSDAEARLAFYAGASNYDVYLDNVSLTQIIPEQPPQAGFTADPVSGFRPLDVQFSNQSSGNISGYHWSFGDGQSSTDSDPLHTYDTVGDYDVTLTVTGPGGSDAVTEMALISVNERPPEAAFGSNTREGFRPLTVQFFDSTSGIVDSWLWAFGDDSGSTEQNPIHQYDTTGVFDVTLIVSGPGGADTLRKESMIRVNEAPPVARFEATPQKGNRPLTVEFADSSSGLIDSWSWNFGDGNVSTEQHPTHVYSEADTFTVSLRVSGPGGSDSLAQNDLIIVKEVGPVAEFAADTTLGILPLSVQFVDQSTGPIDSWLWEFGDDSSSTEQNPLHMYQRADTFAVKLSVSGPGGNDVRIRENYIIVNHPQPVADFSADTTSGYFPLQVTFEDLSQGPVTSWNWEFGDGESSTEQHPVHIYENPGLYNVNLVVTGPGGADSTAKENYIQVLVPSAFQEEAAIPEKFEFKKNYPNPFNSRTRIEFALPQKSDVRITIYNLQGKLESRLLKQVMPAGYHTVFWDASGSSAGTYLIRLTAGEFSEVQKCVFLK